jgi:hypothetical protein
MIDSGMMVRGEGLGISRLGVCQVAPSMATIVWRGEGESMLGVSAALFGVEARRAC